MDILFQFPSFHYPANTNAIIHFATFTLHLEEGEGEGEGGAGDDVILFHALPSLQNCPF